MVKTIGIMVVCLWMADFLTGFAHWLEDTYCVENLPVIGKLICDPNIDHHLDPQDIVRRGTFLTRNIIPWSLAGATFLILSLAGLGNAYTFLTLLFASFGNEVHRWNHMTRSGPVVSFLKESGLIQQQRQHSLHHRPPFAQYYCPLTSQLNPVLERLNFWRRLETVVQAVTGIRPKRENRRDASLPMKKSPTIKKRQLAAANDALR